MPYIITHNDVYYSEEEVSIRLKEPIEQIIAYRGNNEWGPSLYVDGRHFYPISVIDAFLWDDDYPANQREARSQYPVFPCQVWGSLDPPVSPFMGEAV